jgi:hypothetical protein
MSVSKIIEDQTFKINMAVTWGVQGVQQPKHLLLYGGT